MTFSLGDLARLIAESSTPAEFELKCGCAGVKPQDVFQAVWDDMRRTYADGFRFSPLAPAYETFLDEDLTNEVRWREFAYAEAPYAGWARFAAFVGSWRSL